MFYTIYDLLIKRANALGDTNEKMYDFFKKRGIKKKQMECLKEPCILDRISNIEKDILDYLQISQLELYISLGIIPKEYRSSFYNNLSKFVKTLKPEKRNNTPKIKNSPFFKTEKGKLYNYDCMEFLPSIESDSVDLVFADPPFNLKKIYGEGINDNLNMTDYLNWCFDWIDECIRITKPGGMLFIYNIPKWSTYLSEYINKYMTFRNWITVDMKYSLPISGKLSPSHYALISYVKGDDPNVFNKQRIPLQTCRHCGGELKDYGGYKNKMNPEGVNISDVWNDIYPVRHKSTKNRTNNELSIKLLDRIISMYTNEGDVVLDPFGGSGTTYIVSELLNRKWIGCELGDCNIISDRFANIEKDQKLLNDIYDEKNILFPPKVKKLRLKNGFWLDE